MHKLTTIGISSENPQAFAPLGYFHALDTARQYLCKDAEFPRIDLSLPQRLGVPLKATFLETENNSRYSIIEDPLEDIVAISNFKIPELELNNRPIKDVLNSRPLKGNITVQPTPKKRGIEDINAATPTASVLKRRRQNIDTDLADMSCDISVDGFIGTDKILRMVDSSLVETPDRNIAYANPKVQSNAPGPSPRNSQPKYLYNDVGIQHVQSFAQINPFRKGVMPPPNWREFVKR